MLTDLMRVALLITPRDFKDESVAATKQILEKWHVAAIIACYSMGECTGYHGATYRPEINAEKLDPEEYDALVIIDGQGVDLYKLPDYRPLLDTIKLFHSRNKLVAGIGNAVKVLARANIIADAKIALPNADDVRRFVMLYKGVPSRNFVELDKGILTLNTADSEGLAEFGQALVEGLGVK